MVTAMIEQIDRRRAFYLTLVHGSGVADPRVSEVYDSVRSVSTDRVIGALGLAPEIATDRPCLVGVRRGPGAQLECCRSGRPRVESLDEPRGALRAGARRAV